MVLVRRVIKHSALIILPLSLLSLLVDWNREGLRFLRPFGNPDFMTVSIIIGAVLGIANLKGLIWGLDSMLGTQQGNTKLVFLSLLRLFILFGIVIVLAALKLINLLGFLIGMTVVFFVLIKEALKEAQKL